MTRHRKSRIQSGSLKNSLQTFLCWIFALALLPVLWASFKITAFLFPRMVQDGTQDWWMYLIGASFYLLMARWIHKPMWFYVFAHELTHAVSGLLSGAKIYSFKATSKGGEVRLSKSNVFVALSPYIFPFYTLLLILIYALLQRWWTHPWQPPAFQILLGMTLAFHWSFTWEATHRQQPDLKILGLFLSSVLILLGNVLILGTLGVSLFKTTPPLRTYMAEIGKETVLVCEQGLKYLKWEVPDAWTR